MAVNESQIMEARLISLCITTMNRYEMTVNCFKRIIGDKRIAEIIISDDCSSDNSYEMLLNHFIDNSKVKLFRNNERKGVYENKKIAVELASSERVCIIDSDNEFSTNYLDKLYEQPTWNRKVILAPSWAHPAFDYRSLIGQTITKETVSRILKANRIAGTCLNTFNFFVNREEYLSVWIPNDKVNISDSIYFNMLWLQAGNEIKVIEGLEYYHKVHEGSNYKQGASQVGQITTAQVETMLKEMK